MDLNGIANATAAWVEAWLHGNAQPGVVRAALARLAEGTAADPRAQALVRRGQRIVDSYPFGSVQQSFAAW